MNARIVTRLTPTGDDTPKNPKDGGSMRKKLSPDERRILQAALELGPTACNGSIKCDKVLRAALGMCGAVDESMDWSLKGDGDDNRAVRRLYCLLRSLVKRGFLNGKGNLRTPAGPQYTECGITDLGRQSLESSPRAKAE